MTQPIKLKEPNKYIIILSTHSYFESLIFLKIWMFVKQTRSVDYNNYAYKITISAKTNVNYQYIEFLNSAWCNVVLTQVLDTLNNNPAVHYKEDLNNWLEKYNEDIECISEFIIHIEAILLSVSNSNINGYTHGRQYFEFYIQHLQSYTNHISNSSGRIIEYIWGCVVVGILKIFGNLVDKPKFQTVIKIIIAIICKPIIHVVRLMKIINWIKLKIL